MRLVVGGDHAGFLLKQKVVARLRAWGHEVEDIGTFSEEPVDFPDVAEALCQVVARGGAERGILVCGTGVGAAIAANKCPGIRAAVCHDTFSAHQSVEHDDVNVVCIGAWIVGEKLAFEILERYLDARFDPAPEFSRRIAKLHEMERRLRSGAS